MGEHFTEVDRYPDYLFVYALLLMFLGFKFVENLDLIEYYLRAYNWIVRPILVWLVILFVTRRLVKIREKRA